MPRPANRVAHCQESARIRSDLNKLAKRIPHRDPPVPDAAARYWLGRAVHAMEQLEKAWDYPEPKEDE